MVQCSMVYRNCVIYDTNYITIGYKLVITKCFPTWDLMPSNSKNGGDGTGVFFYKTHMAVSMNWFFFFVAVLLMRAPLWEVYI